MKTKILMIFIVLFFACCLNADIIWDSGYHEINDGDVYDEIWMYNGTIVDMWGGDVFQLSVLDSSRFNMFGGTIDILRAGNDSTINIYGGTFDILDIGENASLDLYAYDVQYHPTGGYWNGGWVEGKYLTTDNYFEFDIRNENVLLFYINIVPEPTTLLSLGLGWFILRKKK